MEELNSVPLMGFKSSMFEFTSEMYWVVYCPGRAAYHVPPNASTDLMELMRA